MPRKKKAVAKKPRKQYTTEQKIEAATIYAMHGTQQAVMKTLKIPQQTISDWMRQEWWHDFQGKYRDELREKHIARYDQLADAAIEKSLEKIDEASAKDAVTIAAIATDKSRLLQNMPTQIRGDSDSIRQLAETFRKLSEKQLHRERAIIEGEIVEGEVSDQQ